MAIFNKVYKKVANNGNSSDYALVGQVGVDGNPLDIYKLNQDPTKNTPGLIPSLNKKVTDLANSTDTSRYFLGTGGWHYIGNESNYDDDDAFYMNFDECYALTDSSAYCTPHTTTIIPSNGSEKLNVLSVNDFMKIELLHQGYGLSYSNGRRIAHGYGNASVSCVRNTSTVNVPAFTKFDQLNDGYNNYTYAIKNSNNQIKLTIDGLYFVELRYNVKSAESWGRIDICPYINGNAQRFLSTQGSNGIGTGTITCFHSFFIDVAEDSTLEFKVTAVDDEVTTTVTVADVMVSLIDSSKLVNFHKVDLSLTNRDSI